MVDTLYQCQLKDMSNFLDDEWLSPERTPILNINNMFDHAPAMSLPTSSPSPVRSSGYLQPRVSPAFGHGVEDLIFTMAGNGSKDGLGITNTASYPTSRPTAYKTSSPEQGVPNETAWYDASAMARSRSFTASIPQPMPLTPQTVGVSPNLFPQPVSIAPHPSNSSLRQTKRPRSHDQNERGRSPQRQRSNGMTQSPQALPANKAQPELSEEDQLLLKLKHEENLPWKDIAREFETRLGRTYQVPALQMRHKRLRERMRTWTEDDVSALEAAYEYWEKSKFEIVSHKMLEFGAQERWAAKYCERKWEELHPGTTGLAPSLPNSGHPGTLHPGHISSAVSHESWTAPESRPELDYRRSTSTVPLMSRCSTSYAVPVLNGSPAQRSPVSISLDSTHEG